MNVTGSYFWPMAVIGFAIALISGAIVSRRESPVRKLVIPVAISMAAAVAWHWPLGAADSFAASVDSSARRALDYYEMTKIDGHLHRNPLSRTLTLSGPADDFQHSELVRLLSQLPGVTKATWSANETALPLIVEGLLANIGGFLVGLFLAYLVELRRRYNAQWNW